MKKLMSVAVSELYGVALDWAVAKCEWGDLYPSEEDILTIAVRQEFSKSWGQSGGIVEREKIGVTPTCSGHAVSHWEAVRKTGDTRQKGDTALVAAMRCYVAAKVGEKVAVPAKLIA